MGVEEGDLDRTRTDRRVDSQGEKTWAVTGGCVNEADGEEDNWHLEEEEEEDAEEEKMTDSDTISPRLTW